LSKSTVSTHMLLFLPEKWQVNGLHSFQYITAISILHVLTSGVCIFSVQTVWLAKLSAVNSPFLC